MGAYPGHYGIIKTHETISYHSQSLCYINVQKVTSIYAQYNYYHLGKLEYLMAMTEHYIGMTILLQVNVSMIF